MRDRLIELIESARYWGSGTSAEISDHLLANGVIVPPCKVGQTVYCIRYDKARKPFVKPLGVLSITMYGKRAFTLFTTKEDALGKTVFLTKEEAEQAIAEMNGGAE